MPALIGRAGGCRAGWGAVKVTAPAQRNPGTALNLDALAQVRINTPAVERRAATLPARRSLKKDHQAAWLLNAVRCIDLTTLSGDDTPDRVTRLCAKARQPIAADLLAAMGVDDLTTGAVCVYPTMVAPAKAALAGSAIPVASVATGFPAGLMPLDLRLAEIRYAVDQGADEIDIVITRAHVLRGEWAALYDELRAMREACGAARTKAILATGDLKSLENVARASHIAMQAGADWIKTSTGKEGVNATLPVSLVMARAIRDYHAQTGHRVGFKPAGGLRTAKDALNWQVLMFEELGRDWLSPGLFRIGASSLLGDIERQISHHVTGRYASAHRFAIA
ncbi:MAG: deoxyribose-phosphate aldolase [Paracoccus sp. (in: a-proteobacteria)]|uniref:deoxyribose-phosphate aldolase n=1 Tax=Paracoccus sp. TaxID=267 RepID=UPI0026DEBC69|nr:deoxyribose-phosphate aldolase [Paracoccus sp. (in: a-proteobacteria)]MDO5630675.1 deoxyribose-phosphate aldolase [Paracoccus sp. (in: a-proteobacteria)]